MSSQDTTSPLDNRTWDSQVDLCEDASPTGVNVPSYTDHTICTSPANVDRTVFYASPKDTSSPLDNIIFHYHVDACKDASSTGVGVPFSPCASHTDVDRIVIVASAHLLLWIIELAIPKWMLAKMPLLCVSVSYPHLRITGS